MIQSNSGDGNVSNTFTLPPYQRDRLHHVLLGNYDAVIEVINRLEVLRYCERIAWSDPAPTGREDEHISIMSCRVTPSRR
jgi:hypothetical protein